MKRSIKSIILSTALISSAGFAQGNSIIYKNDRGSILELSFNKQEALSGTFKTAVASKECKQVIGKSRPVEGYIDGSAITLIISYPSCGSLLSLSGHINKEKNMINTIAVITHQMKTFTDGPGSQMITHDKFIRLKDNQSRL